MKQAYSGSNVLALVLVASAATACAGDDDRPHVGGEPAGEIPTTPVAGLPTSNSSPGNGGDVDSPKDALPARAPEASAAQTPGSAQPDAAPAASANDVGPTETQNVPTPDSAVAPAPLSNVVTGTVTDSGAGAPRDGLAGAGTLATAATVRVSQIVGSALEMLGEAPVVGGLFQVPIPLGVDTVVAQALDTGGQILGSAIVGVSGSAAGTVIAAPITTETSLEAAIVLVASGCSTPEASTSGALALDVAALVDRRLTAAVTAAIEAGADINVLVQALANAVVASATARANALGAAGVEIDVDAALEADIRALSALGIGLSDVLAGKTSLEAVTSQLLSDLDAALVASADASASLRVRAQVAASLTFVSTLSSALSNVPRADAIVLAAIQAAAQIEAKLAAGAVIGILELADAAPAVMDAAVKAGDALIAAVASATSVAELQQARLAFIDALVEGVDEGDGKDAGGGLLGGLLTQTTGAVNTLLGSVLDSVAKLASELDGGLQSNLAAVARADVCGGANASAELDLSLSGLIGVLSNFSADVDALGPTLGATPEVTTQALTDLLSTAQVLLRALPVDARP